MGSEKYTKFIVRDRKRFVEILSAGNSNLDGKIGEAAADAAERLLTKIREVRDAPSYGGYASIKAEDNIYRIIDIAKQDEIEFTINVLNPLICLLINPYSKKDKFFKEFEKNDVEAFFNIIQVKEGSGNSNDRDTFHKFMEDVYLLQDELRAPFNYLEVELDEHWDFVVVGDSPIVTEDFDASEPEQLNASSATTSNTENSGTKKPNVESLERVKRKRYVWAYVLFTIVGLLVVIYLALSGFFKGVLTTLDETIDETFIGEFDPDPSGTGIGFFSINDSMAPNTANKRDTVVLPNLKLGDYYMVVLYVDFRNHGTMDIKNAKAKIHIIDTVYGPEYQITAQLSGEDVPSIYDTTLLTNLPEKAILKPLQAFIENSHGDTDPKECIGYSYGLVLNKKDLAELEVSLDVLDTYEQGWCDQGYFTVLLEIENVNTD